MGIQRTLRKNMAKGVIIGTRVKFLGFEVGIVCPVGTDPRVGQAFEQFMSAMLGRSAKVNVDDILAGQKMVSGMMEKNDFSEVLN